LRPKLHFYGTGIPRKFIFSDKRSPSYWDANYNCSRLPEERRNVYYQSVCEQWCLQQQVSQKCIKPRALIPQKSVMFILPDV